MNKPEVKKKLETRIKMAEDVWADVEQDEAGAITSLFIMFHKSSTPLSCEEIMEYFNFLEEVKKEIAKL